MCLQVLLVDHELELGSGNIIRLPIRGPRIVPPLSSHCYNKKQHMFQRRSVEIGKMIRELPSWFHDFAGLDSRSTRFLISVGMRTRNGRCRSKTDPGSSATRGPTTFTDREDISNVVRRDRHSCSTARFDARWPRSICDNHDRRAEPS